MPNATPREARDAIGGQHAFLIDQIGNGDRLLWLGSGISRNVAPPLSALIERAIDLLQERLPSSTSSDYQDALDELLGYADLNGIDASQPVASWDADEKKRILDELVGHYSNILGIDIPEGEIGYDLLKIIDIYSDPHMKPDAEHYFLAMLVEEGCCEFMVTANWDPMIENAHDQITSDGSPKIRSIASAIDNLNSGGWEHTLFKIHGCAKKCAETPDQYRDFMVGTDSQIAAWIAGDNHFAPIKTKIIDKLRTNRSLFVGLSGQDFNLKSIVHAQHGIGEANHNPPRVMFTSAINSDQRTILKGTYGSEYYRANRQEIVTQASINLWAKPLLGVLYLMIMARKLQVIVRNGEFHNTLAETLANEAITGILERIDESFDELNHDQSWVDLVHCLINHLSNFLNLYRKQTLGTKGVYKSLHSGTLSELDRDENVSLLGYETALSAIGLLFAGERDGMWEVRPSKLDVDLVSQFDVNMPGGVVRVFVVDNVNRMTKLEKNGYVDKPGLENVAIFYGNGEPINVNGDEEGPVEFWLGDILEADVRTEALKKLESELKAAAVV